MTNTSRTMGKRIREWRKAKNLKGYELAKIIKLSQGSLSDIENCKSQPSADTLKNLHIHTDINVIWVLTGIQSDPHKQSEIHCHTCEIGREYVKALIK